MFIYLLVQESVTATTDLPVAPRTKNLEEQVNTLEQAHIQNNMLSKNLEQFQYKNRYQHKYRIVMTEI